MILLETRNELVKLKIELTNSTDGGSKSIHKILKLFALFNDFESDSDYLKYRVYSILSFYSGKKISEIKPNYHLKFDLSLNKTEQNRIRIKLNKLIREQNGKKYISPAEGAKLKFVKDLVKVVNEKIKNS